MKDKVYITGHRVPDTDSICSALAYAELKNRLGEIEAIPIRIGELNQETRFVLDYFKVAPPRFVESLQPRLKDVVIDRAYGVDSMNSMFKATEIIQSNHLNNVAVVDADEKLVGIVSLSNITTTYANIWDDHILGRANTPLSNILEVLAAKPLYLPDEPRPISGNISIYAMQDLTETEVGENDILLVGNRIEAQRDAIEHDVSLLVLTNGTRLSDEVLELAKAHRVSILSTSLTTYMAARLLPQAVPVGFMMTGENLVAFHLNDYVEDVSKIMANTRYRSYPVLDAEDRVVGSISRYHLINIQKKKLILVDHNERSQSIEDIEDSEILEIIDHHRVANVSTSQPIYFRNMPVGCTSTIISQLFFEKGVRPSKAIAGLMCSAIISDTLLFRSPTATIYDRLELNRLAPIAGIDPETYAMEMFRAGTDLSNKKPTEILTQDVKFFNIEGVKTRIAQVFTMNLESLDAMKGRLIERMREMLAERSDDTYILAITDIFAEESCVIAVGEHADALAAEYHTALEGNAFMAPGLLSRKKQLIPSVATAFAKAKRSA